MSACNFSISLSKDPVEILDKIKHEFEKQNGSFEGDATIGQFHISVFGNTISGNYLVKNNTTLDITITEKPFLVSCGMIESFLKSKIGQ